MPSSAAERSSDSLSDAIEEVEEVLEEEEEEEGEEEEEMEELSKDKPSAENYKVNSREFVATFLEKHVISSEKEWIPEPSLGNRNYGTLLGDRISFYASEKDNPKNGPNGWPDGVIGKEELQPPERLHMTSMPRRRPRSSSPCGRLENASKRATVVCDFFAKGWCIKGNSCTFLHQKNGIVSSSQWSKEDISGPSWKGDFLNDSGLVQEAGRLKSPSSNDPLVSSNVESPSKSNVLFQRALVRTYGGENPELRQLPDNYSTHKSLNASGSSLQEEYRGPFRNASHQEKIGPCFDSLDKRDSTSEAFISRKYSDERWVHHEMPKEGWMNDAPFPVGSLKRNSLAAEDRYYSGGLSTTPSLYQNSGNQQSKVSFDALQPVHFSALDHHHAGAPRGSTLHSPECIDLHRTSEFGGGYSGSRSISLPRSSSPHYSRPKLVNIAERNFPEDLPGSARQQMQFLANAWEPSVPFRSSFGFVPTRMSSPGSQYDPFVDSIEPPTVGTTIHSPVVNSAVDQHINSNFIQDKDRSPICNSQIHVSSFSQPREMILGKSTSAQGLSGMASASVPSTVDGSNSIPKEHKGWIPSFASDGAYVNGVDLANCQVDMGRDSKESKSLKLFRAALVEYLKELIKPFWREGHLSKDAHKMVVKKAVEKVLRALQPHQIPITKESIDHYLSFSRSKLLKLVEGYVEKYTKGGPSNV